MDSLLKNQYVRRAKISEYKFRKMLKYFAEDLSATQIALKTAINRNTVNRYLNEIRLRITEFCEQHAPFKEAESLTSGSEFRNRVGACGSNLSTKLSTNLGLLKRRGKVYAELIANCTTNKLRQLLEARSVSKDVAIHAVEVKEDFGLIAVGYDNNQQFANQPSYVANLDKFWTYIKSRTTKFQGIAHHKLYLHLKESEFRFNFRNENLYEIMLKLLKTHPLS